MAKIHDNADLMREALKAAGLKVTPPRLEVFGCLLEAGRPLSHAEIQSGLPDLDRVTLYRTLSSFVGADIAHQVQGLDGMWRFCAHHREGVGCPGNHPHFLCASCGAMTCLTDQSLPRVEVGPGFEVSGKQFVAYGLCVDCVNTGNAIKGEALEKS
jgi:Fur family ferric uptake transcriptional regulator/Fur family zinc uptake transcriptional regulator